MEMERKKPSFNSHEKGHPSKKNAEGTSRRTKKSKIKPSKGIISSEEISTYELLYTDESRKQRAQLCSCSTASESSRQKYVRKLNIERITPSTYELLKKEHTTKQTVEEASSTKGKANNRKTSWEKRFSGEMVNAGSSRARPYAIHSRPSSEDNSHLKASKEMERKRPSSSKSLRKIDLSKKIVEVSQPTQSSRNTYKNIDNCEDNSTEESRTDGNPLMGASFSSTDGNNRRKEWCNYQPLPDVIKRTENSFYKRTDSGEKITFGFFPSFGIQSDARDGRLDTGVFPEESSTSEVLQDCRNLTYRSSTPFIYWANISYVMRCSEVDKEREKNGARKDPKQSDKDFRDYRDRKIQQDNKEKQSTSKTDHSEPQEDASKSITPMVNSTVETKCKNYGTEATSNAFAESCPKVVNNDIVKKEGEKTKDLTSRSKIDDAKDADKMPTYRGSNENITDLKSSPIAVENKGLNRLSYLSYVLKENRPRPSI